MKKSEMYKSKTDQFTWRFYVAICFVLLIIVAVVKAIELFLHIVVAV